MKVFESGDVCKFVFEDDKAIWETVAYKKEDRAVVCISCQSGCPVGCSFCGTGKRYIRDLYRNEMCEQVEVALKWTGVRKKTQIMAMSMGEPMLAPNVFRVADSCLSLGHHFYISTVGISDGNSIAYILQLAALYKHFGLQISLHQADEARRKKLLGSYPGLMSFEHIRTLTDAFTMVGGNPAYFNYICTGKETMVDAEGVARIVRSHHLTCSVMCNTKAFKKGNPAPALRFADMCAKAGVANYSVFDPAGQDTIGGGCGQLLYVQEKLKKLGMDEG